MLYSVELSAFVQSTGSIAVQYDDTEIHNNYLFTTGRRKMFFYCTIFCVQFMEKPYPKAAVLNLFFIGATHTRGVAGRKKIYKNNYVMIS